MRIDTKNIVKQSERFALNIADQISKIKVQPFCEISFHSSEFRDKETLKKYIDKIPKSNNPLIYVLQVQSLKKMKRLIEYLYLPEQPHLS